MIESPPELAFHNFKVFEGKNPANPTAIKGQYPLWSIRRVQMLLLGLGHPTLAGGKCYRQCRPRQAVYSSRLFGRVGKNTKQTGRRHAQPFGPMLQLIFDLVNGFFQQKEVNHWVRRMWIGGP
jgi:hypothetical protein